MKSINSAAIDDFLYRYLTPLKVSISTGFGNSFDYKKYNNFCYTPAS
ncbi:hypothetical protein [Shewanella surugensis]|uniref:Uncharacterized protein n=1 Tax=Shewanella surugensis TaxID=212020 RepID=A0ABT0L5E2_9GAMM|nr:hypothetical protein [Shewanella surugensis]MCL1122911.1 hypothetical protein [Shewanella surugensis]